MIGRRFHHLVVESLERRGEYPFAICLCDCGRKKAIRASHIREGRTKSCGCQEFRYRPPRNGATDPETNRITRTYSIWAGMHARCGNPKHKSFARYGGRGIHVCDRWRHYAAFFADMGESPPGAQIDRIDNDGHYEPGNCRWASRQQQARNKSTGKLVEGDAERIRDLTAAGFRPAQIARHLSISSASVSNVRLGKQWLWVAA